MYCRGIESQNLVFLEVFVTFIYDGAERQVMPISAQMEARVQRARIGSFLWSRWSQGSNRDWQIWWQVPLTEPSPQHSLSPLCILFLSLKNISPANAYKKLCLIFNGYETLSHLTLKGDNLSTILPSLCEVMKHPACNIKFLRYIYSSLNVSSSLNVWSHKTISGLPI